MLTAHLTLPAFEIIGKPLSILNCMVLQRNEHVIYRTMWPLCLCGMLNYYTYQCNTWQFLKRAVGISPGYKHAYPSNAGSYEQETEYKSNLPLSNMSKCWNSKLKLGMKASPFLQRYKSYHTQQKMTYYYTHMHTNHPHIHTSNTYTLRWTEMQIRIVYILGLELLFIEFCSCTLDIVTPWMVKHTVSLSQICPHGLNHDQLVAQ